MNKSKQQFVCSEMSNSGQSTDQAVNSFHNFPSPYIRFSRNKEDFSVATSFARSSDQKLFIWSGMREINSACLIVALSSLVTVSCAAVFDKWNPFTSAKVWKQKSHTDISKPQQIRPNLSVGLAATGGCDVQIIVIISVPVVICVLPKVRI